MWNWAPFNKDRDFGGVELRLGVVGRVPVDFEGWQMLNCIVVVGFGYVLDGVFVSRDKRCYCPSADLVSILF